MAKDLSYNNITTDTNLAGGSNYKVPSELAVKTYVDTQVATREASFAEGRIIGTSGQITISNNSGSVIGGNVTVSIESTGDIKAGTNILVSGSSKSVIGGNVTVSLTTCGNIKAVDPVVVTLNTGSVIGSNVTVSIPTLGRVMGAENQVTVSSNSGSVIGANVTVSLENTVTIQAVTVTNRCRIPFGTVATQTASGETGTIQYNDANIFVALGTDNWARATLTTSWE